ncbi:SRPBCC domain-containing protein [Streptomyces profundus]|uniref:SRPBCC domain-containing protein n=1 Tax=Streptomyces profundus TaxID=2867410 RepID=UPI001D168657|nr:SRPBCC domain-containing protein [Streptomyces sp. MA3_2.13]UED82864.1 SRPBCC domain-containing protein [Streptomyces sp. MA3_2.13]
MDAPHRAPGDTERSPGDATGPEAPSAPRGTFVLTRDFSAPRADVFRAFAEPGLRARWFRLPGRTATAEHRLDFRVGGEAVARNVFSSGGVEEHLENQSRFLDLVPDERFVFAYTALVNGVRRWVSLVTVELADEAGGSRLSWTEHYSYLVTTGDGSRDVAHLRGGTALLLNGLSAVVEPDRHRGPRPIATPPPPA